MIRGLTVGVLIGQVLRRELITGLVVGLVIAAAFLPIGLAAWDDADVSVAVAVALFAACSTATVVAMVLPWLFSRLGTDPAFGSGPFATVVQDLLSLLILRGRGGHRRLKPRRSALRGHGHDIDAGGDGGDDRA